MNRLLEFSASLALFFLEASLFESLAEEDLQGFTQMQKAVKLTNAVAVATKTWNDLKPPKTIYNHLQPPQKIQQPSTTTSKTPLSLLPAVGTCLANI